MPEVTYYALPFIVSDDGIAPGGRWNALIQMLL